MKESRVSENISENLGKKKKNQNISENPEKKKKKEPRSIARGLGR